MELVKLHKLHEEEALSKARIKQDIQSAYEVKLTQLRFDKSIIANRALKAGASKTSIGRAVGTSNFNTVQDLLDMTKDQFVSSGPTPDIEVDVEGMTLTVHWVEYNGDRFSHEITYPLYKSKDGKWSWIGGTAIFEDPYYKWMNNDLDKMKVWSSWSERIEEALKDYDEDA